MPFRIPSSRRLAKDLGRDRAAFLERCVNSISSILPHIDATGWRIHDYEPTQVKWASNKLLELKVQIGIKVARGYSLTFAVRRKRLPAGVGAISRTLSKRERVICESIASLVGSIFADESVLQITSLIALDRIFEELVVAEYLRKFHDLEFDPEKLFRAFRLLAEQTYEKSALTFGCIIDPFRTGVPQDEFEFPDAFLEKKRYRVLSDGYRTSYVVSKEGYFTQFADLPTSTGSAPPRSYFPEWSRDMAMQCRNGRIGVLLTRHGDILILEAGTLRLTYRAGHWQYWNHSHLVDLLRSSARAQRVSPKIIGFVVNRLYRAALDSSFRRSGALFVLLRNRQQAGDLVRAADLIGNQSRPQIDEAFDLGLPSRLIQRLPTPLLVELASLDGAVVVNNSGELMAYGAVLDPKRKGRADAEEGSRTKAAIGASKYGLALKVSADGEIVAYREGREFIRI